MSRPFDGTLCESACICAPLQALPASARLWFSDLRDRDTSAAVERYTAASVSGGLLAAEFSAVTEVRDWFSMHSLTLPFDAGCEYAWALEGMLP